SIDGPTTLAQSDQQLQRFEASGWAVQAIDGHDPAAIGAALAAAQGSERPQLIACKTTIGFGAPAKQGKASTHGEPLGADEIKGARELLSWPYPPFEMPADVLGAWRAIGARGAEKRKAWEQRAHGLNPAQRASFGKPLDAAALKAAADAVAAVKSEFIAAPPKLATRVASQKVLEKLVPVLPCLIGGSA